MVYELLSTGASNAISARELAQILDTDRRSVSALVERERRAGKPICANCNSRNPVYFIPATRGEMAEYCRQLKHRAGEIYKTRAACLKVLESLPLEGGGEGV